MPITFYREENIGQFPSPRNLQSNSQEREGGRLKGEMVSVYTRIHLLPLLHLHGYILSEKRTFVLK